MIGRIIYALATEMVLWRTIRQSRRGSSPS